MEWWVLLKSNIKFFPFFWMKEDVILGEIKCFGFTQKQFLKTTIKQIIASVSSIFTCSDSHPKGPCLGHNPKKILKVAMTRIILQPADDHKEGWLPYSLQSLPIFRQTLQHILCKIYFTVVWKRNWKQLNKVKSDNWETLHWYQLFLFVCGQN